MAYGERLVPQVIDELAKNRPNKPCFVLPRNNDFTEVEEVTFARLANAINRMTRWVLDTLGDGEGERTLCYIGPSDIRYYIMAVAACKAGWRVSRSKLACYRRRMKCTMRRYVLLASNIAD